VRSRAHAPNASSISTWQRRSAARYSDAAAIKARGKSDALDPLPAGPDASNKAMSPVHAAMAPRVV
jgi:hypothetical protein